VKPLCVSVNVDPVYSCKVVLRTYGHPAYQLWRVLAEAGIACSRHPFRMHTSYVLSREDVQRSVAVLRLNGYEVTDDDALLDIFTPELKGQNDN